jgi:hypothetical protein
LAATAEEMLEWEKLTVSFQVLGSKFQVEWIPTAVRLPAGGLLHSRELRYWPAPPITRPFRSTVRWVVGSLERLGQH